RETASTGNSLRVTSENRTPSLHKGFLVPYQAVGAMANLTYDKGIIQNKDTLKTVLYTLKAGLGSRLRHDPMTTCGADSPHACLPPLPFQITASGMDPSRFCGQQGSLLGSPPGQREFVSSGNSLRLTFRAPASEDRTPGLHKGFLALYQAVGVNHSQPTSQASGDPEAINTPGDNSTEIQSHCQEPYYQAVPAGTLTCTAQVPWKQTQEREEVPRCVPVCGRPVIPIAQNREPADYRPDQTHNFHGDIALLELRHRVPLGPHLLPVCLPDRKALYRPGLAGYVSGFGVENGWLTTELKYSRLPVAPRAACEAWLRAKRRTEVFSGGMFCAGDSTRPQRVCQGDSGGAYVVWDDRARRWVATGIVSWGIGCGEGYGFYTKVLNYVDWIRGVMDGKDDPRVLSRGAQRGAQTGEDTSVSPALGWTSAAGPPVLLDTPGHVPNIKHTAPPEKTNSLIFMTSPLYPKPYPDNFETTTVITVPTGYRVKLIFWQFDLEPSEGCFYDYVKISADKKTLGRFCGQLGSPLGNPPGRKEFMSQGNKMLLTFHTDFSNEENGTVMFYKGFLAYYQAVDLDECASQLNLVEENPQPRCQHLVGRQGLSKGSPGQPESPGDPPPGFALTAECSSELFTEPSGYISSLEYPQPYPPDLRCNYSIRVERGLTLQLKFLEPFEIDDHQQVHCPYDQLQIYANERNIGEFCGKQRPEPIDTSSNSVDLLFFTDESGDSQGWKLHYTSEVIKCPQPKTLDSFTIIQDLQPQYEFRDYFIATCKQGYQLTEGKQALLSFTAVCQDDGTWHRAMPRCKIKDCGQPRSLPNGAFNYTTTTGVNTYQARIQYYCHEPYYKMQTRDGRSMSERGRYTCTAQGIWKNELAGEKMPRCLPGGGALLGDRWILTAAHTLYPKDYEAQGNATVDVFLGHVNVEEITKLANHPVRRVSVHPNYRQEESHNFEGDIALLELENSVTLGPNLLPICLPDNETFYDQGLMGYVSGFGIMEERLSHNLRFVRLPIAKREVCESWLRKKNRKDVFSENMFCSGDPTLKQDACQGDSGGVFAVRDEKNDRWVATGIVSWGIGCSRGYGFYTKLLNYVDWIKKEMGEED
ncbi:hypothetical protein E2I00_015119, partial [Balaenoptera physalus]